MTTATPRSYKIGVKTPGDRDWSSNSLRFASADDAAAWAADLALRWTLVQEWTVLPSDEEPNR